MTNEFKTAVDGLRSKRASLILQQGKLTRQIAALDRAIKVLTEDESALPEQNKCAATETLQLLASRAVRSDANYRKLYTVQAFASGSLIEYRCDCMAFRFAKTTPYLRGGKEHCKHIRRANQAGFPDEARAQYRILRGMTPAPAGYSV